MDNFSNNFYGGYSPADYRAELEAARKKEKHSLFLNASKLGALLILYNIFNWLFAQLYWVLAYIRYSGKVSFDLMLVRDYLANEQAQAAKSTEFLMTGNLFVVAMSVLALVLIAQFLMGVKIFDMLRPYKEAPIQGIKWLPTCLVVNIIMGMIVSIIVGMLNQQGVTVPDVDFSITEPSAYAVIIQLVYVCLIGPVCEELVYRGLILKLLLPYGKGLAIFFSALAFGLMHGNIEQALPAFVGGLVWAMIVAKYDSIVPTIILHIINNTFASVLDIGDAINWSGAENFYTAAQIVFMFLGFYGLIVLIRGLINETRQTEPPCSLAVSVRYRTVALNVFMLVYFAYILLGYMQSFLSANQ